MENYDVVIVGSATSGAYFARKMAEKGYNVKMIDALSKEKLGSRFDIVHMTKSDFKNFHIPTVKEGDEQWAFEFTENHFSSPSNKYLIHSTAETVGLHMHEYVALMVKLALEAGAQIEYEASFKNFIFEYGKIKGITYEKDGKIYELHAKTVVDCSGSKAICRTSLPKDYGIETFSLSDDDMFYVILRYAQFEKEQINTFWLNTKSWFAPFSLNSNEKIIGTGAIGSFKNVEKTYEKLDKSLPDKNFSVSRVEKGTTPYTRPPYTLVADNFIVTGDAGCLTKPECGEGITSSMVMIDIAVEQLDKALKKGDTSKQALWKINSLYNRKQGADFCLVRAFLTKVVDASDDEIEYCFSKRLIFDEKFLNNGKVTVKDILAVIGGICLGVTKKKISLKTITSVLKGATMINLLPEPKLLTDLNKDSIKFNSLFNRDYFEAHTNDFVRAYVKTIIRNPDLALKGHLLATIGFWDAWKASSSAYICTSHCWNAEYYMSDYFNLLTGRHLSDIVGPRWYISSGLLIWLMLLAFTLCINSRSKKYFVVTIPTLSLWLTLMIAAPLAFSFRYVFSLLLCIPIYILGITEGRRNA